MGNQIPLINLSAYWMLSNTFLVIYYTAIMQFFIFFKNCLYPHWKIDPAYNTTPLWNQYFLTHKRFFTTVFLLNFGRRGTPHGMTLLNQLAPKQVNLQNTTAWLQNSEKKFIKRPISTYLPTLDLRKQEIIRKIPNWVETYVRTQSLLPSTNFC